MNEYYKYDVLVVGCGLSGVTVAERYANALNKKVLIIDKRNHIGGNCYDFMDETGILCNLYGPHFFHTNDEEVWEYINQFGEWERYDHRVIGKFGEKLAPIPVNITTVNVLCEQNIRTEKEMDTWLQNNQVQYENITNSEEMAKSRVGEKLYDAIFKDYTFKQWNRYPDELNPEVLKRIPVRNNFDDRYFSDKYQVLPKLGYTEWFKKILANENISIRLDTDYFQIKESIPKETILIYTGPIDRYFADQGLESLEYRSLNIVFERYKNMNYYQTHTQVNYPSRNESFTRITEYKHCLNQQSPHTTITKEYSTDIGEPYYPVLSERNMQLFEKYKHLAEIEATKRNIHFIGRLANYKYFNMDEAIKNALVYFHTILAVEPNA